MAEASKSITNPLYGLKVGSLAFVDPVHFGAPVLKAGLAKFISGQSGEVSMSGSSEYIYTDMMNQGSLGVSGSYGVSGISKFSGKVSAYCGQTHANSGKTLSIRLNSIDWAGVEYLDFNTISMSELMSSLSPGASQRLATALEKFIAVQKSAKDWLHNGELSLAKDLPPVVTDWIHAVEAFHRNFGTGLVVGVLWGGWGTAQLDFHTTGEENRWKYGGSGNFTYAGTGAAVSISAAYGGSSSTINQNASAKITSYYNGACMKAKIEQWVRDLNELASKGLSALGSTEVTRNASLAAPIDAPAIPDPVTPKKDPKVTDLFKEIKSLDGLKAYAQAAAWQKRKKAGKDESLLEFLSETREHNDVSGVPDSPALSPLSDNISPLSDEDDRESLFVRRLQAEPPSVRGADELKAADLSGYEPLGVWIVNWAQLFPWLVSGHDNAVPKDVKALGWIRLKTLHQDCLSLTRLYDRLEGEGCKILVDGQAVPFGDIRDSFSHVAALISQYLSTPHRSSKASVASFIAQLSDDARKIYTTWDAIPLFRQCELGAGVTIHQFNYPGDIPHDSANSISDLQNTVPKQERCAFRQSNFSAFARFGKAWPVILPDGNVVAFVSVGSASTSGILTVAIKGAQGTATVTKEAIYAAPQAGVYGQTYNGALVFFWNYGLLPKDCDPSCFLAVFPRLDNPAVNKWTAYRLYPIPFEAADGLPNWRGCAMTTGMGTLSTDLKAIKDELAKLRRWTFDSDLWEGVSITEAGNTKDIFYSMEMMRLSYLGVTAEPPNIMPASQ
jgi:hypothetical protein